MRELSLREVEDVSGAVGPAGAATGAVIGAAGYLGGASTTGEFTWGGFFTATAVGAATGFVSGPMGAARAYVVQRLSFFGGAAVGYVDAC